MSIRAMLRDLSVSTGINFETLRKRWQSGYRDEELISEVGARVGKRKYKPDVVRVRVTRPPALPVRCPDSLRFRR